MSIMVKKLYKNGAFLYKMNLIAGKNGLGNLVQWVHIIEDDSATSFLHGNELVFTAGILNHSNEWLLNFARNLYASGTSAFVINIGPHIKSIPNEVIEYCNEVNMPLFTVPWETRMVDMTRDFCHRIMNNEHVEINTATTIKDIIFNVGNIDTQVQQMERYGYQRDSNFCFISIVTNESGGGLDEYKDTLAKLAEIVAKRMHELFITFSYKEFLILALVNYTDEEIKGFVEEFIKMVSQQTKGLFLHMGVSSNQAGIYEQKKNFEKALSAMKMAIKRNELYSFYEKLGIYKVLYAVNDKVVLREYYKNIIGKLEMYDRENGTQLTSMLWTYLENNGSLQIAAEKLFVHRNTVTNQLKKIEELTGYNPMDLEDKVKFCIAFYIKEIL
ncbi:MAG: PucR family transcriptional regulator ligand-binding domain-containing protein [Eubacteriales bacterium]